jgi:HAD superfamily hydrolase (TIGR01549 family)
LKTPSFIYFDLDDTLIDHRRAERAALADIHREFNLLHPLDLQLLQDEYHRVNRHLWEDYGHGRIDRPELQRRRFEETLNNLGLESTAWNEIGTRYMECYRNHWHWIDGAEDALMAISETYPVGFLTNGFSETQWQKVDRFSLDRLSRHIVVSEDVGVMKPNPGIFSHATQLSGHQPGDILYVGDSLTSDIRGGNTFGWNTAWYLPERNGEDTSEAHFVFSSFPELSSLLLSS